MVHLFQALGMRVFSGPVPRGCDSSWRAFFPSLRSACWPKLFGSFLSLQRMLLTAEWPPSNAPWLPSIGVSCRGCRQGGIGTEPQAIVPAGFERGLPTVLNYKPLVFFPCPALDFLYNRSLDVRTSR
jgi:hypothetical protein